MPKETLRERLLKETSMANDLRIVFWNANGILKKRNELQLFLDNKKIDICLIAEIHLTNQNYITFNGYIVYMTSHPANTSRGGSAIIIKK
jgi:exonuclease III